jgi:solute carrier family 25 (adenine nucleotide translocator) protein 4/5/6/31
MGIIGDGLARLSQASNWLWTPPTLQKGVPPSPGQLIHLAGAELLHPLALAKKPFDKVQKLMQVQGSNPKVLSGERSEYAGIVDCFRRVVAEQGVLAFWRGHVTVTVISSSVRRMTHQSVALTINDFIKHNMRHFKYDPRTDPCKDFLAKWVSGGAAGGLANVFFRPLDVLSTLVSHDLVNGSRKFNGILDCVMQIAKRDGIKGFYRGWDITIAGAFAFRLLQLKYHVQLKKIPEMNPYKDNAGVLGVFMGFIFGFVAKNITSIVMYPFDTLSTRMMFDSLYEQHMYTSSIDCFSKVIQNEGILGLYKGLYVSLFNQGIVHKSFGFVHNWVNKAFF